MPIKPKIAEQGRQVLTTTSLFSVDESFNDPRFMRVRIAVLHSGENLNSSSLTKECVSGLKDSFANIPILANTVSYVDENGNEHLDYGGHDMHIEEDAFDKNKVRVIYDEKVVGVVPEVNNFEITTDKETGNDYAWVDALIYRDYGNYCADILKERGNTTDVSAELDFDEITWSAKDNIVVVQKATMCGITLLGEDKTPAMEKAHATVFSIDDNCRQKQLIAIMQELKESLDNYTQTINAQSENLKKGGYQMDKLAELMAKYNVTEEQVTFETSDLSDEELEAKFAEVFGEVANENTSEEAALVENEDAADETNFAIVSDEGNQLTIVPTNAEKFSKTFALSHEDIKAGLYNLLSVTETADNEYYYITAVYDDSFIYEDWDTGTKIYKQNYTKSGNNVTFNGERIHMNKEYLSDSELATLNIMRGNYEEIKAKLSKYEAEPEKMAVLTSDEYSAIADTEEFTALKEQNNHFDLSVDEVKAKADSILLAFAKSNTVFAVSSNGVPSHKKPVLSFAKISSKYGSLIEDAKELN